jgi:hypothetical protein
MLKKTITYENPFTEQMVTEEHYFHISKADLVEMEMEEHKDEYTDKQGKKLTGMQAKLQRIVDSEDGKAIMSEFKEMIRRSYGKKDGDRFRKSADIWEEFASSEAFSQLLFDLCTNAAAAAEFINGIVPGNLDQIAAEVRQQAEQQAPIGPSEGIPVQQRGTGMVTKIHPDEKAAMDKAKAALNSGEPGNPSDDSAGPHLLSVAEARLMDADDLQSGLATGRYKLS